MGEDIVPKLGEGTVLGGGTFPDSDALWVRLLAKVPDGPTELGRCSQATGCRARLFESLEAGRLGEELGECPRLIHDGPGVVLLDVARLERLENAEMGDAQGLRDIEESGGR